MGGKAANKAGYFDKLKGLLEEYSSIFIVSVDNVSSQQMHEIRQSLRGEGVVLMGKNTMVSFFSDLEVAIDERNVPLTSILPFPDRSAEL
jgi:ribosomal protein L10